MQPGEKRAFKGKYRNHLLAEHNADDRYLGMEILVAKTFEIQFPNDDEKCANAEEKTDERSNTSPALNLLVPEVVLKEEELEKEELEKKKKNWKPFGKDDSSEFEAPTK